MSKLILTTQISLIQLDDVEQVLQDVSVVDATLVSYHLFLKTVLTIS